MHWLWQLEGQCGWEDSDENDVSDPKVQTAVWIVSQNLTSPIYLSLIRTPFENMWCIWVDPHETCEMGHSTQFCRHTLTWFWFSGYHNIVGGWKGGALTEDPWCALCHWGLISFTFLFLLIHANTLEPYFFYFPIKDVTGLFHFLWGHIWWSCWHCFPQKISITFTLWHFLILYLNCIPGWFRNPGRIRNTRRVLRVENQSHWTCIYVFALSYVNIYIFIFADKMTNPLQRSS